MITRENAKALLTILKAYSEGKKIQLFVCGEWRDRDTLHLEDDNCHYRIKPEYRPFKNAEECFNEMSNHQPFGWLIDIRDKYYTHINLLGKSTDFDYLFKIYTFADGAPYGIKEEE